MRTAESWTLQGMCDLFRGLAALDPLQRPRRRRPATRVGLVSLKRALILSISR